MQVRDSSVPGRHSGDTPGHTREELILEHLPQVRLIARQIRERLPVSITVDDLVSAGILGLIAAIDRFDSAQHVKLRTYAEYKIRGAILDSLRGMDWAPRQQRRRGRLIETAIAAAERKTNRVPTAEEIAEELQVPVEQYQSWLAVHHGARVSSLDSAHGDEKEGHRLRTVPDSDDRSPEFIAEREELERIVAQAVEGLPTLEKTILNLYYQEEMTLREIAGVLKLHESRISQLKTQAIHRIRAAMQK